MAARRCRVGEIAQSWIIHDGVSGGIDARRRPTPTRAAHRRGHGRRESDIFRDRRHLEEISSRWKMPAVFCRTPSELFAVVRGAAEVFSDRYHPCICAHMFGKPVRMTRLTEDHKMTGLRVLMDSHPLDALQDLARAGLRSVVDVIADRVGAGAPAVTRG